MTPQLYYFTGSEFTRAGRNWFALMDPRLLVLLDSFRHQWGSKVVISPHDAALGREGLQSELSDHNVTIHGRVYAADVLLENITRRNQAAYAVELAKRIGFTSIGFYPDWVPRPGLHLGTRPGERPGKPATWGGIRQGGKQVYVALPSALEKIAQ